MKSIILHVLSLAMWASDVMGHPAVGSVLHDPKTASAVTAFIASGLACWGIIQHLRLAFENKEIKTTLAARLQTFAPKPPDDPSYIAGH